MDPNYFAAEEIVLEAVHNVETGGNGDHIVNAIRAGHCQQQGQRLYHEGKHLEALRQYEEALDKLRGIPGTECLRSLIYAYILETYVVLGRYRDALALRDRAITGLEGDDRWSPCLAACCGNLGIAFASSGNLVDGIQYLERALALYETIPNAAANTKQTSQNLEILRRKAQRPVQTSPWWKRLFGG
jgi:tetratricopeptide (TPR) repeat protein